MQDLLAVRGHQSRARLPRARGIRGRCRRQVHNENDRRRTFRRLLRHLGGVPEDLRLHFAGRSTRGKFLAGYQSIDPHRLLAPLFGHVRPILDAIARRSQELGLNESRARRRRRRKPR